MSLHVIIWELVGGIETSAYTNIYYFPSLTMGKKMLFFLGPGFDFKFLILSVSNALGLS